MTYRSLSYKIEFSYSIPTRLLPVRGNKRGRILYKNTLRTMVNYKVKNTCFEKNTFFDHKKKKNLNFLQIANPARYQIFGRYEGDIYSQIDDI